MDGREGTRVWEYKYWYNVDSPVRRVAPRGFCVLLFRSSVLRAWLVFCVGFSRCPYLVWGWMGGGRWGGGGPVHGAVAGWLIFIGEVFVFVLYLACLVLCGTDDFRCSVVRSCTSVAFVELPCFRDGRPVKPSVSPKTSSWHRKNLATPWTFP